MWVALAYTHGNRNGDSDCNAYCYRGAEVYADTTAASHTGASAVRSRFTQFVRGLANCFASPRKAVSCLSQSASSQRGRWNALARPQHHRLAFAKHSSVAGSSKRNSFRKVLTRFQHLT